MQNINYYTSERLEIFPFIPRNVKKTLDVGCGTGKFSKLLKEDRDIETWGIEAVEPVAQDAKKNIDHVLTGTYETVCDDLPLNYFDCIFFNDVLEHMLCPEACLLRIKENLRENGVLIASIPNVRHISVLKEIMIRKDWHYREFGILDKTHFRFFTKKSIIRMFHECGYDITVTGINKGRGAWKCELINILTFGLLFNDIKHVQYLVVAKKK